MDFKRLLPKKKYWILCFSIGILLLFTLLWTIKPLWGGMYLHHVHIEGIDVSGQSKAEAEGILQAFIRSKSSHPVVSLVSENVVWELTFEKLGIEYLVKDAIEQAYSLGHQGNWFWQQVDGIRSRWQNRNIHIKILCDRDRLRKELLRIKAQVDRKAVNAAVQYQKGKILIAPDEYGRSLDVDKNIKLIENNIAEGNFSNIPLAVDPVPAKIRKKDIGEIQQVLSSFYTLFDPEDEKRTDNIKLASKSIHGVILFPGEKFSLDKALGPRTSSNGYKEARVIIGSEFTEGIGGGVCQVSSTLYNSVLKSDLQVIERTHHTIPSQYVDMGRDATVVEGSVDFKFANNRDYPIAIQAEVGYNRLTIRILGKTDEPLHVKLISKIIKEYPPPPGEEMILDESLPDGEVKVAMEARKGYKVALYREFYDARGTLLKREKISEDLYLPIQKQVKMNRSTMNEYRKEVL